MDKKIDCMRRRDYFSMVTRSKQFLEGGLDNPSPSSTIALIEPNNADDLAP